MCAAQPPAWSMHPAQSPPEAAPTLAPSAAAARYGLLRHEQPAT